MQRYITPKLLLRIAAGCLLFHLAGHTYGHLSWRKTTDPVKQMVISEMTTHKFMFMGKARSISEYYEGYGWSMSIVLLMMVFIVWAISGIQAMETRLANKILWPVLVCLLAFTVIDYLFFFLLPALTCLVTAALVAIAMVQIRKH